MNIIFLSYLIVYVLVYHVIDPVKYYENNAEKSVFPVRIIINPGFRFLMTLAILSVVKIEYMGPVVLNAVYIAVLDILFSLGNERIKSYIINKEYSRKVTLNLIVYVIIQIFQIASVLFFTKNLAVEFNGFNQFLINKFLGIHGLGLNELKNIFLILYITFSGTYLLPLILDYIYKNVPEYNNILNAVLKENEEDKEVASNKLIDEVKTGRWIGIVERFLIVIFLISNQYSAIGFIIAIKSLARFKMMEKKVFAEYYLLGTLFSVGFSFLTFMILEAAIAPA